MSDASLIVSKVRECSMTLSIRGSIVTLYKEFTPNDKTAYCNAEGEMYDVFEMIKQTSEGSTWGTDSGSVGGHIGLTNGYMKLNKSGCSKILIKQLAKLL